jgi:hypothetical protein
LAAANDDRVQESTRLWVAVAGLRRRDHAVARRSTVKLNIMPLCMCSAM